MWKGCTLGQCESAIEGVICHVESQRPRRLQTETFSWNPDASASVTASVKAVLRIPAEIRRHQACAHETQETITVGVSIIHRVRHLACGDVSTGSSYSWWLQKLFLLLHVQGLGRQPQGKPSWDCPLGGPRVLSFSAKESYRDEKGWNTCECLTVGENCSNPVCQYLGAKSLCEGQIGGWYISTESADTRASPVLFTLVEAKERP